jgi:hypothetical protein
VCLRHRKLHTSTTSGKGAPGSSHTTTVELDWVAVLPLGRRMTDEERGPEDEDWAPPDEADVFALKLATEPTVLAVPIG